MTVEEIFSKLSAHMVKGLMIHSQMSEYYGFLGLKGYQECHKYHYFCENFNYRKLGEFYLSCYDKIIMEAPIENPHIIPETWFKYSKQDVNVNTRKSAIQAGMDKWIEWEKDTKKFYEQMYQELIKLDEVDSAYKLAEYIEDVSEELMKAKEKMIELVSTDYDIVMIMDRQDEIYKKYKRKIKEICL